MISIRWLEKRKPYWARLEQLVQVSGRGVSALRHSELQELGLLYRQTASDLAAVREDAFSETLPQTLIALAIFAIAGLASWIVTIRDPGFAHRVLGPGMTEAIERHEMWTRSIVTIKPLASSGIMTNNLSVAFSTFALGITAGLGTIWMLAVNGVLIGVVGAATWKAGMALQLWSFVAPHGVLELPAIFISGGAGLEIARGLLFPGYLPRRLSLAQAGGRAARLLLGTIPMLLVAGVIEGFFSPSSVPIKMKFLLAAALFAALLSYLFFVNRHEPK